ncbi:MAG TPA: dihydrofolate reductase family protein [Streptosporangiaceae bacterium]|jgi:dihydrofolate reductase
MRELVVTENTTIDGAVDGDFFSPADTAGQDEVLAELTRQSAASGALLVGRATFEAFRSYWPGATGAIADHINTVPKFVVSTTLRDPGWAGTTVLSGPLEEEIRALKAAPGGDIVATGSITLVRALIAAGLVDEYRLFVYPVVRGGGERLFAGAAGVPPLALAEARPLSGGVALLRYRAR